MTYPDSPSNGSSRRGAVLQEFTGVAMALAGSLILLGLVYISNDSSPASEHLLFSLGLALMSLISAGAQILVVAGIVVLWAAARRGRKGG